MSTRGSRPKKGKKSNPSTSSPDPMEEDFKEESEEEEEEKTEDDPPAEGITTGDDTHPTQPDVPPVAPADDAPTGQPANPAPRRRVTIHEPRRHGIMPVIPRERATSPVTACLTVCGANARQIEAIKGEGIVTLEDFLLIQPRRAEKVASGISKMAREEGGVRIGEALTQKFKCFLFWCHEQDRRGERLNADDWDIECLKKVQLIMPDDDVLDSDNNKPTEPMEFKKPEKWVSWSRQFENYLHQVKGHNQTPLFYVIRKDRAADAGPYTSLEEERIYTVKHRGEKFKLDNARVFQIMTRYLLTTDGWTWIRSYESTKDGRGAMIALRNHYDGLQQVELRLSYARDGLAAARYKTERSKFNFEQYCTKLSEYFQILEENGLPKYEREKVDILVHQIESTNQMVVTAKTNVLMDPALRTNFTAASNAISELIGTTVKEIHPPRRPREIGDATTRAPTREDTKVTPVKKIPNKFKGIDLTRVNHNYTKEEWKQIPANIQLAINNRRRKARKVAAAAAKKNQDDDGGDPAAGGNGGGNGNRFGAGAYDDNDGDNG